MIQSHCEAKFLDCYKKAYGYSTTAVISLWRHPVSRVYIKIKWNRVASEYRHVISQGWGWDYKLIQSKATSNEVNNNNLKN